MDDTTSREKVLKSVRNALMSKLDNPYQNVDFDAQVFNGLDDAPEMVFATQLLNVAGKFVYCSDDGEFAEMLKSVMQENKWNSVHCEDDQLQALLDTAGISYSDGVDEHEQMATGLTRCEYLIARLGSVMVSSAHQSGRRMNVSPDTHIIYARASQLVPDIKDALQGIKERYGQDLPSLISLITGPSRTADIEKTLVMGAHGPRDLYVFMVDDNA